MEFHTGLRRNGYAVIPTSIFGGDHRDELLEEAQSFPEFQAGTHKFVMGGFAALGNPSSFHNPTVRKFRQWAHSILVESLFKPLVDTYDAPDSWYLDHMIGRMTIRLPGEKPSRESWHRDEASDLIADSDDKVFGGWINLDDVDQFFSCVPGSHRPNSTKHRGFSKIKKEAAKTIKDMKLGRTIRIPPGSMLVFFENIVHEVVSRVARNTLVRLHLALRLTRSSQMRPRELMQKFDSQGVVMIKSGQIPAMYAKLHFVNWVEKLEDWSSQNVDERCLVSRTYKSGIRAGETHVVCAEHMKSLEEYGFPLYPAYTDVEREFHTPRRQWSVLVPGQNSAYKLCSL